MLLQNKKKRDLSRVPKPAERPSIPIAAAIRMFLVGSFAVAAAIWAVWHHYSSPRKSMLEPAPAAPAASEIPVEMETSP